MAKKLERKKCFVVGPIGADDSDDRIHADWLLEEIIQPVFTEYFKEFDVTRADKISDPGRIDAQVISSLLDSELVIADLTTLNPNAFYEIGIRHTVQKPIIHMHLEGERIPFDIASFRSIKFERKRPKDLKAARELLKASVTAALSEGHEVDNPVTFARGRVEFDKTATPAQRVVQEQLEAMTARLEALERPVIPSRSSAIGVFRAPNAQTPSWATPTLRNGYAFEIVDVSVRTRDEQNILRDFVRAAVADLSHSMNFEETGTIRVSFNKSIPREKISAFIDLVKSNDLSINVITDE